MAKITDMFRQPKKRNLIILLIVIIIIALFIGFYLSRTPSTGAGTTQLPSVPEGAKFTSGTKGLSKEYLQTLLQSERQAAQLALQTGRSAVPTLIGTDTGTGTKEAASKEDLEQECINCCKLLQQYCQRLGIGITPATSQAVTGDLVGQMASSDQISPSIATELKSLDTQAMSPENYAATLNRLVKEGKLTPAQAKKLLADYRQKHQEKISQAAQARHLTDDLVDKLVGAGRISPEDAALVKRLVSENVLPSKFAQALNQLVKAERLLALDAQKLLSAYLAERGDAVPSTGEAKMDELKQSQEKQTLQAAREALSQAQAEQAARTAEQQTKLAEEKQKQLEAAETSVKAQAQQLFAAWNVVPQKVIRVSLTKSQEKTKASGQAQGITSGAKEGSATSSADQIPLVKAGTIMFGVLDTAINSDRAGPVMATIVSGKFKGGKLMGSLSRTGDGQRVILRFNRLTMPDWPQTVSVDAVAMNPDDAQTAIASSVDNHYLLRYGSLFGASFLKGYSEAITNAGQTTLGLGVIQTTHPKLGARDRTLVGLGEVGKNLSDVTRNLFATPPTVRVNAGVGIGLLFMNDVSRQGLINTAKTTKEATEEKTTAAAKTTPQQEPQSGSSSRLSSITESKLKRLQKTD